MRRTVKRLFLGKLILSAFCLIMTATDGIAATIQVDCSSSSTVQTALNNAASGDTVQCNALGTYTWSTVTLPSTKNITLDLNGSTILGGGNVVFSIPNSSAYTARVTNFTINSTNAISTGTGITNKPWRIDHCTINGAGVGTTLPMITTWSGPGLIDHCNFVNIPAYMETIHNMGFGAGILTGWQDAPAPGSINALYIEDCTATGAMGNGSCVSQNYYGGRTVVRHNTFSSIMVDAHGNNTAYANRWWEIYDNTLTGSNSTFCLRGGSGMVFNNTGSGVISFVDEVDNNYGIGHGQNNTYFPAYIWNNPSATYMYNADWCSVHAGSVAVGTDVIASSSGTSLPSTCSSSPPQGYWRTDTNTLYKCTAPNTWTVYYQPLTYPHPLQNGSVVTSAPKPNPPSGLMIN